MAHFSAEPRPAAARLVKLTVGVVLQIGGGGVAGGYAAGRGRDPDRRR